MSAKKLRSTLEHPITTPKQMHCMSAGERRCEDGSCIARVELCPEEQLMNQNTILIMVVVGLAVVVFLVILYCFQQRQRRHNRGEGETGLTDNDYDNASLYAPPPTYEDVINTNLYPPTPQQQRLRLTSLDEPLTPPPNYDAALIILARSQESVLTKSRRKSSVFRRSVSMEQINNSHNETSPSITNNESETPKEQTKRRSIFRFSRQFSRPLSQKDYTCVPSQQLSRPPSLATSVPSSPVSPLPSSQASSGVPLVSPPLISEETLS